jgi:hypothetical protein
LDDGFGTEPRPGRAAPTESEFRALARPAPEPEGPARRLGPETSLLEDAARRELPRSPEAEATRPARPEEALFTEAPADPRALPEPREAPVLRRDTAPELELWREEEPRRPHEARESAPSSGPERPAVEHHEELPAEAAAQEVPTPEALLLPPSPQGRREDTPEAAAEHREAGGERRLGPRMMWNVLHRFRSAPEDSAVEQEKWDRAAFGAALALVGLGLAAMVLLGLYGSR